MKKQRQAMMDQSGAIHTWIVMLVWILLTIPILSSAQSKRVSGVVTDAVGQHLMGVSVKIKGSSSGTATNDEGYYAFENVNAEALFTFSMIGFRTFEIPYCGQERIDITL